MGKQLAHTVGGVMETLAWIFHLNKDGYVFWVCLALYLNGSEAFMPKFRSA